MRLIAAVATMAVILVAQVLVAAAPAAAQTQEAWDECLGQGDFEEEFDEEFDPFAGPPSCTFDQNGDFVSRDFDTPGIGASATPSFGGFIVLALLWSAVPLLIAASMASSRGESVGAAIGLTLILGWVGLAIVWFGQRRTVAAANALADAGVDEVPGPSPRRSTAEPEGDGVAVRLRRLDELHAAGVLTDAERDRRRKDLIDTL